MNLYIGLMSGTSMDGIDAALVNLDSHQLILGITKSYSTEVKQRLDALQNKTAHDLQFLCELDRYIGCEFALAVKALLAETNYTADDIIAIGSHGQTLCHNGSASMPYTLQFGCAHTIAEHTGITVVADFRVRDMVAGGQGAPFAPLYHSELFSSPTEHVAVVNIGGLANVSFLHKPNRVAGWDVGPGNCLLDSWTLKHLGKTYDESGEWAAQGNVIPDLLSNLLSDPSLLSGPPKSMGKEYFSLAWLDSYLIHHDYTPVDVQATLTALTAKCISKAIHDSAEPIQSIYLCGGGSYNQTLVNDLKSDCSHCTIESTDAKGVSADYLEAMMFAWLSQKTISKQPVDLTQITGSRHPVILGAIYPSY